MSIFPFTKLFGLKCLSPQHPLPLYLFSIVLSLERFDWIHFLFALKDVKSGHTLIHSRALKGNGLTSQITLHHCFQKTLPMQSSLWREPSIEPIPLQCSAMDQSVTTLKANKKVNFQSKTSKSTKYILDDFREKNKVEKFVEVTEPYILKKP